MADSKLCKIHSNLGSIFLPRACDLFPRNKNNILNKIEITGSASCPEIARLALLNAMPIKLVESEIPIDRWGSHFQLAVPKDSDNELERMYFSLRDCIVETLQNRNVPLLTRMYQIGALCFEIDKFGVHINSQLLSSILSRYKDNAYMHPVLSAGHIQAFEANLLIDILSKRASMLDCPISFRSILKTCFKGLMIDDSGKVNEPFLENHEKLFKEYLGFEELNSHILENYLVNIVFSEVFPLGSAPSLKHAFLLIMIRLGLIRLLLSGVANTENLTPLRCASIIQTFSRAFEHNPDYLAQIISLLLSNYIDSLEQFIRLGRF